MKKNIEYQTWVNGIIIYFQHVFQPPYYSTQLTNIMRDPVISVHSVGNLQIVDWRKRSIPTHSGWLYPLTFDAEKGLKEA